MTLFDGGRWDRLRRSGWGGRRSWGRLTLGGWLNVYELPLPRPYVVFELCTVTVGLRVGGALNDSLIAGEVEVELPPAAADALLLVWPGRVGPRERWWAWLRLTGRIEIVDAEVVE